MVIMGCPEDTAERTFNYFDIIFVDVVPTDFEGAGDKEKEKKREERETRERRERREERERKGKRSRDDGADIPQADPDNRHLIFAFSTPEVFFLAAPMRLGRLAV